MANTDIQYIQMQSVQSWLISQLTGPIAVTEENCLIVDQPRHLPQFQGGFYIQIYDAMGSNGIMQEGGNPFLLWKMGIDLYNTLAVDQTDQLVETFKTLHDYSSQIFNMLDIQYQIDDTNIPEPMRNRIVTAPKRVFGDEYAIEIGIRHIYELKAFYLYEVTNAK